MNKRLLHWRFHKFRQRVRRLVYSRLYRNLNPSLANSILVAGTARSGTTWLADILSGAVNGRILFEPFNPRLVQPYSQFSYFQYMRPNEPNEALEAFCQQLLTGNMRHPWIDRQVDTLSAEHRVIKAIRANLMLKWINEHFPQVPLIFIIRHPCAVVLSRLQLGWDTDRDIEPFLAQPKLVEDFLGPYLDIIAAAKTDVEKHAIIWCISNLIPLKQFKDGHLHIVFYENLCIQPKIELSHFFAKSNFSYHKEAFAQLTKPSVTSQSSSAVVRGDDPLQQWRNKLSDDQVKRILAIVELFGLSYLYDANFHPNVASYSRTI